MVSKCGIYTALFCFVTLEIYSSILKNIGIDLVENSLIKKADARSACANSVSRDYVQLFSVAGLPNSRSKASARFHRGQYVRRARQTLPRPIRGHRTVHGLLRDDVVVKNIELLSQVFFS